MSKPTKKEKRDFVCELEEFQETVKDTACLTSRKYKEFCDILRDFVTTFNSWSPSRDQFRKIGRVMVAITLKCMDRYDGLDVYWKECYDEGCQDFADNVWKTWEEFVPDKQDRIYRATVRGPLPMFYAKGHVTLADVVSVVTSRKKHVVCVSPTTAQGMCQFVDDAVAKTEL